MEVMGVRFENIRKSYVTRNGPLEAVRDVSFAIPDGKVVGVLGPNGSGKTSLMRMLLDLTRPNAGSIYVNEALWGNRTRDFRRSIGYLPEERGFYKKEKVLETLVYLASLKGLSASDARERAERMLEKVGLTPFAGKPLTALSKGMGQKVQFIASLLHDPSVLIMDEPFSGLDPVNVALVREIILERKAAGALVFVSTHRMSEVATTTNIQAALRSARYPGAGDRSPRRFALGLWENLRAYENHLRSATLCLERLLDATEGEQESGAMDDFDPMEFLVDSPSTGDDSESAA